MAEGTGFGRTRRTTLLAWIALLALMLASLGSAYLRLGAFNLVAGLLIAAVKCAIVAWLFMRLRDAGPLIRLAGVVGLGVWTLLVGLSGVDYATRAMPPAAVQRPRQLLPAAASEPVAAPLEILLDERRKKRLVIAGD